MIVDELITLLTFENSGFDRAEKVEKTLVELEKASKVLVTTFTAAATSVAFFAKEVADSMAKDYQWAKSVGIAADTFQRFDQVAAVFGGNLEDMKADLASWARFSKISGVSVEELFLREAKAIQGMTNDVSYAYLKNRGYSEESVKMIQLGYDALKKQMSKAQIIPEEKFKTALRYFHTWNETVNTFKVALKSAVADVLPGLEVLVKKINSILIENKNLIKVPVSAFFKVVADTATFLSVVVGGLVDAFNATIEVLDALTFGLVSFIGPTLASQTAVGLLSLALTATLIKAIISTYTYFATIVGFIFTSLIPAIISATTSLYAMAAGWIVALGPIAWVIAIILAVIGVLIILYNKFEFVRNAIDWFVDSHVKMAKAIWNWLKKLADNPMIKWIKKLFSNSNDVELNLKENVSSEVTPQEEEEMKKYLQGGTAAPTAAPTAAMASPAQAASMQNNRNITVNNNNVINTNATSGPAIASHLKQANELQGSGFGMNGVW